MRRWAWFGPAFVVAFVASIVVGGALATGDTLYLPDASVADLRAFYGHNLPAVVAQSALQVLAAVALYLFGRGLHRSLWPNRPDGLDRPDRLGRVAAWGNAAAAGFLLLSVLTSVSLAAVAERADAGVVSALGTATLLCGGAVHLAGLAVFVTASSVAGLRRRTRGRWVFRYGRWAGPLVAVSVVSIVWPPLLRLEPLWRLVAIVWIVGVTVAARRSGGVASPGRLGRPGGLSRLIHPEPSQPARPVLAAGVSCRRGTGW
ncbi:hypothetical protein [Micromonospora costi]|uniref:DUF998 domain-containing protein n=1 Tax=Micromonospora costi TaxID=1530042 RepID=A0A3A9ZTT3_9ACTN|nr:hypothetical protein [Micromonospora costi]RKN51692.1 hypothetical protein D7193_27565 [Micromonospora costi]